MNRNYVKNSENGRNSIGKKNLQCAFFGSIDCLTRRYLQYDRDRCLANPNCDFTGIRRILKIIPALPAFHPSAILLQPLSRQNWTASSRLSFLNFLSYLFYKKFLAVFTNADIGVKNWIECRSFKLSCHNFIIPFENTPPCQKKCKLVWC